VPVNVIEAVTVADSLAALVATMLIVSLARAFPSLV
jgi:hypothetical protein